MRTTVPDEDFNVTFVVFAILFILFLVFIGCSSVQRVPTEFQPQKACIFSYHRETHNRLFERVLIVGEANGTQWTVYSLDNPRYTTNRDGQQVNFTYPINKDEVQVVGMPQCPSDIWGLPPSTIYDLNKEKENRYD